MKCPLRFTGVELDVLKPPDTRFLCLKEGCAWWDENSECCSELANVHVMTAIGNVLGRIHDEICLSLYTYTCHDCRVRIEVKPVMGHYMPERWARVEQADGKFTWLCDQCSPEAKEEG